MQELQQAIGARVRQLRRKHRWSQDALAARAGLNRAHLGEIERGEVNLTLRTLKCLADTLRVRVVDLVDV